jgi:hypothetical protein
MLQMVITWHGHYQSPLWQLLIALTTNWHVRNQDTHVQTTKIIQSFAKMVENLVFFYSPSFSKFPLKIVQLGTQLCSFSSKGRFGM